MNSSDSTSLLSRREFLGKSAGLAGAVGVAASARSAVDPSVTPRFQPIVFSKPFQTYSPRQTAELVASVGWAGIECPVRAKGQIEPERAPDELPQLAEALRRVGADIHLVATDILKINQPHAETVLRTMADLGLKRFRLGFFSYPDDQSPIEHLKEIAPALKDIADACKDLGLQAGFQNHSGARQVGAPVWDVYSMIQSLDPRHIGFCFDIGHATVEGGLSWPIQARLAEPFYTAILVKDFTWRQENGRWTNVWCPLGEGMVHRVFFDRLKQQTAYRGPICQHFEYGLGDSQQMLAHMRHDLQVLKEWLV